MRTLFLIYMMRSIKTKTKTKPRIPHACTQIVMRVFTPSAAKQLALSPVDVRRSDPRTGEEVSGLGDGGGGGGAERYIELSIDTHI